jgi:hypothetical protein
MKKTSKEGKEAGRRHKDLEEMEEEEGTYLERGEGTLEQNKGTPEDKNTKIQSEKISD